MRVFVAALLFLPMLAAADLRIDHVTFAGKNLDAMRQQLLAAGIGSELGGPHSNHATEMAVASFPDGSYIELIAPQKGFDAAALAAHPWGSFISGDAGPCAWALRPHDFEAEVSRIRASGTPVKIQASGRTRPDGVSLQWETATIGDGVTGTFLPFLIRDITDRQKRAYPSGKASNRDFSGLPRVVIAVNKLSDALDRFHNAYPDTGHALKQVDVQFGAQLAWIPDSPVIFAEPAGSSSQIRERIETFGEGPCAFILSSKKTYKRDDAAKSRWFGRDIRWFDPAAPHHQLGVELP